MNMIDGNTAALRMYEATQERLEKQSPTASELEQYIEDWMDNKAKELGSQFITEAFVESDSYAELYKAFVDGDQTETGRALFKMVENYWRPFALGASLDVNFAEGRYD
jgi:hypothetical protein